jgi:hypothetical protein
MSEYPTVTLRGTVERIIPPLLPGTPEKAQISVESADPLYRDVRIENTLTDESGDKVSLKLGSPVKLTITANAGSTALDEPQNDEPKNDQPKNDQTQNNQPQKAGE